MADMLPIIFFSVLFGLGIAAIGERGKPVLAFFQGTADAMFWVTNLIMKFAPIGVFGLIGVTVSKFGLGSLIPLGKLMILVYATMIFFVIVVLGGIAKMVGSSIFIDYQSIERRTDFSVFNGKFGNCITKSDGENGEDTVVQKTLFPSLFQQVIHLTWMVLHFIKHLRQSSLRKCMELDLSIMEQITLVFSINGYI